MRVQAGYHGVNAPKNIYQNHYVDRLCELAQRALPALALAAGLILAGSAAGAQEISIDLGEGQALGLRTVQLFILLTLLSLAPGLAIMVTCFPFMVTVLSILRQAIGVQQG
jgi:flagellar biosynthetic protein FliP